MLEHATLLLRPPDAAAVQAVVDPADGAPLGFARPLRPPGFWGRWFAGPVVEVHEYEDASLLCVIRGAWMRPGVRRVYDADARRVGSVNGRRLEDPYGRVVAVRVSGGGDGDEFCDANGRPLAALRSGRGGVTLAFSEALAVDPFARMLVLAASLSA